MLRHMLEIAVCTLERRGFLARIGAEQTLKSVLLVLDLLLHDMTLGKESPAELETFALISPDFVPDRVELLIPGEAALCAGAGKILDAGMGVASPGVGVVNLLALLERAFAIAVLKTDGVLAKAEIVVIGCRFGYCNGDGGVAEVDRQGGSVIGKVRGGTWLADRRDAFAVLLAMSLIGSRSIALLPVRYGVVCGVMLDYSEQYSQRATYLAMGCTRDSSALLPRSTLIERKLH